MIKYKQFLLVFLLILISDSLYANKSSRRTPSRQGSQRSLKPNEQVRSALSVRRTESARPPINFSKPSARAVQSLNGRSSILNNENEKECPESLIVLRYQDIENAVMEGDLEVVQLWINNSVDVNVRNDEGKTLLHKAVIFNQTEIARALLDAGADMYAEDKDGKAPFFLITKAEILRLFISKGADPNVQRRSGGGETLLHFGNYSYENVERKTDSLDMISTLIELGADPNGRNNIGQTPLHTHSSFIQSEEIVRFLIDNGANVNARDSLGRTPLHIVEDLGPARVLIDRDADVHARDKEGKTPLHLIVEKVQDINIIERLVKFLVLEVRADVLAVDNYGNTPLFYTRNVHVKDFLTMAEAFFKWANQYIEHPVFTIEEVQRWVNQQMTNDFQQ